MKKEELDERLNNIKQIIGEEQHGKIVGEISVIINENEKSNQELNRLETELKAEKEKSDQYLKANAVLLQQVSNSSSIPSGPSSTAPITPNNNDEDSTSLDWSQCFDKRGNFKV